MATGKLTITLQKVNGLLSTDTFGPNDSFCEFVDPFGTVFNTSSVVKSMNPDWTTVKKGDPKNVATYIVKASDASNHVSLLFWDEDPVGRDFNGEVKIKIGEIITECKQTGRFTKDCSAKLGPREKETESDIKKNSEKLGTCFYSYNWQPDPPPTPPPVPSQPSVASFASPIPSAVYPATSPSVAPTYGSPISPPSNVAGNSTIHQQPSVPIYGAPTYGSPISPPPNVASNSMVQQQPSVPVYGAPANQSAVYGKQPDPTLLSSMSSGYSGVIPPNPSLAMTGSMAVSEDVTLSNMLPGSLTIAIVSAKGLINQDGFGSGVSDPFVSIVDMGGKEVLKSARIDDDLNPVWENNPKVKDYQKTCVVDIPLNDLNDTRGFVTLKVFDYDIAGSDDPLGEAQFRVADVLKKWLISSTSVPIAEELKLVPKDGETDEKILKNKSNLGHLTFKFSFQKAKAQPAASAAAATGNSTSTARPADPDATGKVKTHPSTQVSIQNFVTKVQLPAKMTLTIRRAAALKNQEMMGTSDPKVKVYLDSGTTGSASDSKEVLTSGVVSSNLNPVFEASNSTLEQPLHIAARDIDNAPELTNQFVTFEVWDDNVSKDDLMGGVCLSLKHLLQRVQYALNSEGQQNVLETKRELALQLLSPAEYIKSQKNSRNERANTEGSGAGTLFVWVTLSTITAVEAAAKVESVQKDLPKFLPAEQKQATPGKLTVTVVKCIGLKQPKALALFSKDLNASVVVEDSSGQQVLQTSQVSNGLSPIFPETRNSGQIELKNAAGMLRFTVMDGSDPYAIINVPVKEILKYALPANAPANLHLPLGQEGSMAFPLVSAKESDKEKKQLGSGAIDANQALKAVFSPIHIQYGALESSGDGYVIVRFSYAQSIEALNKNRTVLHTAPGVARIQVLTVSNTIKSDAITVRVFGLPPNRGAGSDDDSVGFKLHYKDSVKDTRKELNETGFLQLETGAALPLPTPPATLWFPRRTSTTVMYCHWAEMKGVVPEPVVRFHVLSKGAFIGEGLITVEELLCTMNGGKVNVSLAQRANETSADVKNAHGQLGSLSLSFHFTLALQLQGPTLPITPLFPRVITGSGYLLLAFTKAEGLMVADKNFFGKGGDSDPMLQIIYKGVTIHSVPPINNTLNPLWGDKGLYVLHLDQDLSEPLKVKLIDHNTALSDTFIGMITLTPKDLAGQGGKMSIDLKSENGQKDATGRGRLTVLWSFEGSDMPDSSNPQLNLNFQQPPAVGTMSDEPLNQPVKEATVVLPPNTLFPSTSMVAQAPQAFSDISSYLPKGPRLVIRGISVQGLFGSYQAMRQQVEQRLGFQVSSVCLLLQLDGRDHKSSPAAVTGEGNVVFTNVRFTVTPSLQGPIQLRVIAATSASLPLESLTLAYATLPLNHPHIVGQASLDHIQLPLMSHNGVTGSVISFEQLTVAPKISFSDLTLTAVAIRGIRGVAPGMSVGLRMLVDGSPEAASSSQAFPATNAHGMAMDVSANFVSKMHVIPNVPAKVNIELVGYASAATPGGQVVLLARASLALPSPTGGLTASLVGERGNCALVDLQWNTSVGMPANIGGGMVAAAPPPAVVISECMGVATANGQRTIGSPMFMTAAAGQSLGVVEVLSIHLPNSQGQASNAVTLRLSDRGSRAVVGTSEPVTLFGSENPPNPAGGKNGLVGHLFYVDGPQQAPQMLLDVELIDAASQQVVGRGEVVVTGNRPDDAVTIPVGQWQLVAKMAIITGVAADPFSGPTAPSNTAPNPNATALAFRINGITLGQTNANFVGTLVIEQEKAYGNRQYSRTMPRQLVPGQQFPVQEVIQLNVGQAGEVNVKVSLVNTLDQRLSQGSNNGQFVPQPPNVTSQPSFQASHQGESLSAFAAFAGSLLIPRTQRNGHQQLVLNQGGNANPAQGYGYSANQQAGYQPMQGYQPQMGYSQQQSSYGMNQPQGGTAVDLEWFWLDVATPDGKNSCEVLKLEVLEAKNNASNGASEVCVCIVAPGAANDWRTPFSGVPHVSAASFVNGSTQQAPTAYLGLTESAPTKLHFTLMGKAAGQVPQPPYYGYQQPSAPQQQPMVQQYQQSSSQQYQQPMGQQQSIHMAGAEVPSANIVPGDNQVPLLDARGYQVGTVRVKAERIASTIPYAARAADYSEGQLRGIESRLFGVSNRDQQPSGALVVARETPADVVVDVSIFGPMGHKFSTRMLPHETFQVLRDHLARHLGISEELQELAYVGGAGSLNTAHMMVAHQQFPQVPQQNHVVDWNMTAPQALRTAQSIGAHTGSPLSGSPQRQRHRDDPAGLALQLGCTDRNKFFIGAKLPSGDDKPLCVDSFTTVGALKYAIAGLMSTPKQKARMAALAVQGPSSRTRRLNVDDSIYPEQLRLMINFQELQGDQTSLGTYGIVSGSVIIVSTNFSNNTSQGRVRKAHTVGGGRVTVRLLGPDGGLGNVVQASQDEPIENLRSVLVSTRKYNGIGQQYLDCYVDGSLVLDEGLSLIEARCQNSSTIQFCYQGQHPDQQHASLQIAAGPVMSSNITIDIEDSYGNSQQVTVSRTAAVSSIRRLARALDGNASLSNAYDRSFASEDFIFLNGRLLADEGQSIEMAIKNGSGGTHFEVRPPKNSMGPRHAEVVVREDQRHREIENLTSQMDVLQDQLNRTVSSTREHERRLATQTNEAEHQLQEERRRHLASIDRISELERAMDRQQDLLRRAATTSTYPLRNNRSPDPRVMQALARVNSPSLRNMY